MDFRVEVSLWNMHGAHNGQAAAQLNVASDFSDKLGLNTQTQAQEQDQDQEPSKQADDGETWSADAPQSESALLPNKLPSAVAYHTQAALLQQRQLAQLPGVVELYPLGMQAGQHLSHMPYGFLQTAEQAAQRYAAMAEGQVALADTHAPEPQQVAAQAEISAAVVANSPSQLPAHAEGGEAVLTEQLSLYLAQKWPERSSVLLPRGNGIELLIRDYHLTPDEQESLVAELLVRMRAQAEQPQQIWINGQCVWQLNPSSSIQGEKQNGY